MNIKIYLDYIIHLNYKTQYLLTSTMMRLQEFYESPYPEINGKFFTLEKFMDVYAKNMKNFTYTIDWSGFNIPDTAIRNFHKIFKRNFLEKEKVLFKTIKLYLNKGHKFYLIGTYGKNNKEVLKHEIAHALYYLNNDYRKEMDNLLNNESKQKIDSFGVKLLKNGYCENVLSDEMQAYWIAKNKNYKNVFDKYMKGVKI